MQLALLCLWSEPIGFWKLDNLLCSWLEQELRRQDWLSPGPLSTVAARVYFLVIAVEWSLFVISFSAWDPLLFFRIVVCMCKRSLRIQRLGCRGPNAPVHKHRSLAWATLLWSCAASSSLWVWFCLLYLREGRRAARAPVNAATMGRAASLLDVSWRELQRDYQCSQWPKVILKKGKDCFKLFSLNFIVTFCMLEHRAEGWEYIDLQWPARYQLCKHGGWVCAFWIPFFSRLDILQKVSQEMSLGARHQAEALGPARRPLVLIHSSWKWA